MSVAADPIRRLARAYGLLTEYVDAGQTRREADREALLAVLGLLGAPLARDGAADAADAVRARRAERARRPLPRTLVSWLGEPTVLVVRLPVAATPPFRLELRLEGERDARVVELRDRDAIGGARIEADGETFVERRYRIALDLPAGYHGLRLEGDERESLLLAAPVRVHAGAAAIEQNRAWGVFMPVHAMRRTGAAKPIGDLDDLAALADWVAERGGHVVATLPMLAGSPDEPSPYSPISRLFWNEVFLAVPGDSTTGEAAAAPGDGSGVPELVDYAAAHARKRRVLERDAEAALADGEPDALAAFRRLRPDVESYARFRATTERRGESWWSWPERMRAGELRPGDYDEAARRFHLFAQWRMHESLDALARRTRETGAGLYLDLPLGVHPDGYDVWRHRDAFATDASVGAPPDPFFTRGQDWGFPPLRPDAMRDGGFAYTIETIRNHLRYAGVLRLDHVMGLHRQFWLPRGMDASRGVYVRYPARELYAILSIESHRAGAAIVGENLGTVPDNVNTAMQRHAIRGMHVVQFEVGPEREPPVTDPAPGGVASLNTHDMPTFTTFWTGRDLRQRVEWGLLDEAAARREEAERAVVRERTAPELGLDDAEDARAATHAWLERLAASDAALVLVGIEDLWGETRPHNVPGTWREMPNWRRRSSLTLEAMSDAPGLAETIETIARLRREKA